jgi:hypothetical protein
VVEETIDPARRDILKTGAVMGGGALLYPTAKKIGMFDELAKGAKVAARTLPKVKGMPEWFSPLVSRIEREGTDVISQAKKTQELEYKKFKNLPYNYKEFEIVQSRKIEIPAAGKKEPDIITMTEYKNGDVLIESNTYGGAFDSPFELYYSAPKEISEPIYTKNAEGKYIVTGQKKIKKEGEFVVYEDRPQYASPNSYYDDALELDQLEINTGNAISDLERLEEIATRKKPNPEQIKKRKEHRDYVQKNPREDADSRLPDEPRSYYDD